MKYEESATRGHAARDNTAEGRGAALRPPAALTRARGWLHGRSLIAFAYQFYWVEHQAADLAAGIAFRLLINLFPLFGVVGTLVGLLLWNPDYAARVIRLLFQLFPAVWQDQVPALAAAGQNAGTFGLIGFLVLCWFGTTLLESIGHAFFRHYGIPVRRSPRLRVVGLLLIVALALVLIGTVFLTSAAAWLADEVQGQLGTDAAFWPPAVQVGTSAAGYLLAFVLLLNVYWLIPNIGLRPRDVWPGALLSATLFALALQLFPLYLRFRPVSTSGGTFGFIFLLTTWLYLLAHILLLGNALNAYRWRVRRDCPAPPALV